MGHLFFFHDSPLVRGRWKTNCGGAEGAEFGGFCDKTAKNMSIEILHLVVCRGYAKDIQRLVDPEFWELHPEDSTCLLNICHLQQDLGILIMSKQFLDSFVELSDVHLE